MTDKPAVGKNNYRQALTRGKQSINVVSMALNRIVNERPGPQTTAMLLTQALLAILEISRVLDELDEIGRYAKTTGQLPPLED